MPVTLQRALHLLPDVTVAALAGPLMVSGIAKTVTPADQLDWPVQAGPLTTPHGPKLVAAAELAATAATVLVPGRLAGLVPMTAYTALAVAAHRMKGAPCACFGAAHLAAIGRTHLRMNAVAAAAGAAASAAAPGRRPLLRAGVMLLSSAVTYGVVRTIDRRQDAKSPQSCDKQVSSVRLFVSDDCPACRSLKHLLTFMEPARRDTVSTTVVNAEAQLPQELADLGVPCALGLDVHGEPVCAPASGIGGVKALIDSVTLVAPAVRRAS
ncbi:hypothetical protein [Streptomyces sp. A5-4]|uniref:hypothetical protein n=1 Tax=Streptomyces sp. A5-4 TaxID=3384771 RepID=UPI003DA96714